MRKQKGEAIISYDIGEGVLVVVGGGRGGGNTGCVSSIESPLLKNFHLPKRDPNCMKCHFESFLWGENVWRTLYNIVIELFFFVSKWENGIENGWGICHGRLWQPLYSLECALGWYHSSLIAKLNYRIIIKSHIDINSESILIFCVGCFGKYVLMLHK